MQQYLSLIFLSMPINALVVLPVLLLKIDKREKIGLAIRLYVLSIFLVASAITIASNCVSNSPSLPVWAMLLSGILFMITLVNYVKYSRKLLNKWKRRILVLASFLILLATRANVADFNYGMSSFTMVWYGTFIFAFLLAYMGTSDVEKLDSLHAGLMSATSQGRVDKSYAPQHEIDHDVHIKGKDVLNDPGASLIERRRYSDAIKKKENQED
ncbi:hypothetical protein [Duffyella gerundensis]|uniref:hypothetical protein n=1 Tax=Duffyella gerundensis TaxID=1619313 RepID=UPI001654C1CF|nr:hypothetical protein [Duffyella gerundensis]